MFREDHHFQVIFWFDTFLFFRAGCTTRSLVYKLTKSEFCSTVGKMHDRLVKPQGVPRGRAKIGLIRLKSDCSYVALVANLPVCLARVSGIEKCVKCLQTPTVQNIPVPTRKKNVSETDRSLKKGCYSSLFFDTNLQ